MESSLLHELQEDVRCLCALIPGYIQMGYRPDMPFSEMPKVYMDLSMDGYQV